MPLQSATLTVLRQGFEDYLGEAVRGTTSGAGNAGGTTFVDATDLIVYPNTKFPDWWAMPTSGTYSGQIRRVSSFVGSTGIPTVLSAYGGQIAGSVTYELTRHHPLNDLRYALNVALHEVYPALHRSLINEDLVTGNAIPNGSFEDFIASATVPDYWELTGAGATSAKDTTNKKYGAAALSLTRVGTDCNMACTSTLWPALLDLAGETTYFECWVKASVASRARIGVSVNGGTATYSSYHTGGNTWELLRVEKALAADMTSVSFACFVDTGNTSAYFDYARWLSSNVSAYVLPGAFLDVAAPRISLQQIGETQGNEEPCDDLGEINPFMPWPHAYTEYDAIGGRWLLRFTRLPVYGYKIRLVGEEPIPTLTATTDTAPLNVFRANLLYPYAAYVLFRREYAQTRQEASRAAAEFHYRIYQDLKKYLAQRQPKGYLNFGYLG